MHGYILRERKCLPVNLVGRGRNAGIRQTLFGMNGCLAFTLSTKGQHSGVTVRCLVKALDVVPDKAVDREAFHHLPNALIVYLSMLAG